MDRKINRKVRRHDPEIPKHQRWLYELSEVSLAKIVLVLFGLLWLTVGLTYIILKIMMKLHK